MGMSTIRASGVMTLRTEFRTAEPAGKPQRCRLATQRIAMADGTPPATTPRRTPSYNPAKAVGSFVPAITRKTFEKHGFSTAALIMEWHRIVGDELARLAAPERLKWPRCANLEGDAERPGATLVLRVDPAAALEIEYKTRQILERINTFFGYPAVAAVRIVQAALVEPPGKPAKPATTGPEARPPEPAGAGSPLEAALNRLEAGVRAANRR